MNIILRRLGIIMMLMCYVILGACNEIYPSKSKLLSRRRRYVAFPEGSSFSCAGCMTVGLIGQPAPSTAPGTFTFGLNWAIAYELPNATETTAFYTQKYKYKKPVHQRRSRRELYEKIETILDRLVDTCLHHWALSTHQLHVSGMST
ncbi:uncharacterized protein LOC114244429 [Bombyx mandarina]|uniref:Uncharacterized protein LOC114244429 n=1 Tax=Bombyx mandarina TaxID=7092 RepID=A0A6J2JRX6_BOMMA|nr:uncharacterized protein LOC114244429 [Bombyx mandarina]